MPELPFDTTRPHHKKKDITPERQLEILRKTHWGVMATTNADGGPYCVPIGFAYDESDGSLLFHTPPHGEKISNLARDNRVCYTIVGSSSLVAEKFSSTFESLVIFGRLERITDPDETLRTAVTFCSKFAPGATEGAMVDGEEMTDLALMMQKAAEFMSMYRLIPEHISSKQRMKNS